MKAVGLMKSVIGLPSDRQLDKFEIGHCHYHDNEFQQQIVNIFGFMIHAVSVTTTQLCYCSTKRDIDNLETNDYSCAPIKLFL